MEDNKTRKKLIVAIAVICVVIVMAIVTIVMLASQSKKVNNDVSEDISQEETEDGENGIISDIVNSKIAPLDDEEDPLQISESENIIDNNTINQGNNSKVTSYGIDVSKYQGVIDWESVAKDNVKFAMIRVGYRTGKTGELREDPYAEYNLYQAQKAGVQIGIYFFSTAVNEEEALEEANWVTEFIKDYPITYPVVYNCEGFNEAGNRMNGLSIEQRTTNAKVFLEAVRKAGYNPMFYASKNELINNTCWNTDDLSSKYDIWISQYISTKYSDSIKPDYTGVYSMWQYTSTGRVDGIEGDVDMNVAYFGYTDVAKSKSGKSPKAVEADPEIGITFEDVNEQVTAKQLTNLRIYPMQSESSSVIVALKNGEYVTRTGIGDNGWSRIEYNGQTVYGYSDYLITKEQDEANKKEQNSTTEEQTEEPTTVAETVDNVNIYKYEKVNETVTAKIETNLRDFPSTDSDSNVIAVLKNGETVTRIGIGTNNGWSKVEYNGTVLYAVTSYLTTVSE